MRSQRTAAAPPPAPTGGDRACRRSTSVGGGMAQFCPVLRGLLHHRPVPLQMAEEMTAAQTAAAEAVPRKKRERRAPEVLEASRKCVPRVWHTCFEAARTPVVYGGQAVPAHCRLCSAGNAVVSWLRRPLCRPLPHSPAVPPLPRSVRNEGKERPKYTYDLERVPGEPRMRDGPLVKGGCVVAAGQPVGRRSCCCSTQSAGAVLVYDGWMDVGMSGLGTGCAGGFVLDLAAISVRSAKAPPRSLALNPLPSFHPPLGRWRVPRSVWSGARAGVCACVCVQPPAVPASHTITRAARGMASPSG